jgi:SpoVK/Ycf46/Vps4 family AAA+-type ATPase
MSLYIEWLNLIKMKADVNWLLKSQVPAYNSILTKWLSSPFINFYGPPGSGKSFIARMLASKKQFTFATDLERVPEGSKNVLLDDANYSRHLRIIASERRLSRIILITQSPVKEAMPLCEIKLNEADVRQFEGILGKYCHIYFTHSIPEGNDLNQIIIKELKNRGEAVYEH